MSPDFSGTITFRVGDKVRFRDGGFGGNVYDVIGFDANSDALWLSYGGRRPSTYSARMLEVVPPDRIYYYVTFGGLPLMYDTLHAAEDCYIHTPVSGPKLLVKVNLTQGTVDILRHKP